jgi:hypothetical protein
MHDMPTVVLFFAEATEWDVASALDEIAEPFQLTNSDPVWWYFPSSEDWRVRAHFQDNDLEGCTAAEREHVHAAVGRVPACVLNLTMHCRRVSEACDAASILTLHLLARFYGAADERRGNDPVWYLEDIRNTRNGVRFLDCYR